MLTYIYIFFNHELVELYDVNHSTPASMATLFYEPDVSAGSSGHLVILDILGEYGGLVDAVEAGRQDGDDEDVEDHPDGVDTTLLLATAVGDLLLDPLLLQIRLNTRKEN